MELTTNDFFSGVKAKSGGDSKINSEQNDGSELSFDFMNQFISLLVTNFNTQDLSVNPDKFNEFKSLLLKSGKFDNISDSQIKNLLKSIKSDLNASGDINLNLEKLIDILKKNLKELHNTNKTNFNSLLNNNGSESQLSKHKGKNNLLVNIRKYLTDDEYQKVKHYLNEDGTPIKSNVKDKTEINTFFSNLNHKESEIRFKIENKSKQSVNSDSLESKLMFKSSENSGNSGNIFSEKGLKSEQLNIQTSEKTLNKDFKSASSVDSNLNQKSKEDSQLFKQIFELKEESEEPKILTGKSKNNEGNFFERLMNFTAKSNENKNTNTTFLNSMKSFNKKTDKVVRDNVRTNFVEQTIKTIKLGKAGKSHFARIQLQPESLGKLNMIIDLRGNQVKVKLRAENREAREVLEKQLPLLKEKLAESGLKTEEIIFESNDSDTFLDNNQENSNKYEEEILKRQYLSSMGKAAANKDVFDEALQDVEHYEITNPDSIEDGYILTNGGNNV